MCSFVHDKFVFIFFQLLLGAALMAIMVTGFERASPRHVHPRHARRHDKSKLPLFILDFFSFVNQYTMLDAYLENIKRNRC